MAVSTSSTDGSRARGWRCSSSGSAASRPADASAAAASAMVQSRRLAKAAGFQALQNHNGTKQE